MTPLLPRGGRRGAREPAAALRARRRDRRAGADGRGSTSGRCSSGSIPAASRVDCSPSRRRRAFIAFDLLALGDEDYTPRPFRERRAALERALAARRAARPPDADHARRGARRATGSSVRGRRARRRDREGRRDALPAGQARDGEGQARPYRRLRARRLPAAQVGPDAIGSLLLGLYDDGDTPASQWADMFGGLLSVGVVGAFPMPRAGASCSPSSSRSSATSPTTPGAARAAAPTEAPRRRGQPLEPRQGPLVRPAPARARARGALRPHGGRALPAPAAVRPLAPRPRAGAPCGYAQLERPVRFELDGVLAGRAT